MNESGWSWARLDERSLALVLEAEATIGADVVLVYAEGAPLADPSTRAGLQPTALDPSQLECLQGMERMVGGVAVAYSFAH